MARLTRLERSIAGKAAIVTGAASGMDRATLLTKDVREVDGMCCFVVEPRADRPLKTASSRRVVPVHDALIRLGLLEWRDQQANGGLLFPCLRADKHGSLTAGRAPSQVKNRSMVAVVRSRPTTTPRS